MSQRLLDLAPGLPAHLDVTEVLHSDSERSLWKLWDRVEGRAEVLKIIHPGAPDDARRGIAEEFLLLDRIRHPNWVRAIDYVHLADGAQGYRMEHVAGTAPHAGDAPGWGGRDLEAVRQLLGALCCLHAIGYVHLDVKPSQMIAGPRGNVLIDPGLAALSGAAIMPRGTWGFIAPEVLKRSPWDRRADLFSVGCTIVQVWTGENPLGDGDIAEQIRGLLQRPRLKLRERLDDIPEGLDRVVEGLIDPDPERRPRNATQAWEALHTMAGYREFYFERRRLPIPEDIPFYAPDGVEARWDEALRGAGPEAWTIEGPIGSGRRRLMERLRSRAAVLGARCSLEQGILVAEGRPARGSKSRQVRLRIGEAQPGEEMVELGAVGAAAATAALEAYGLDAEGREAEWTRALLRLRLEERSGEEIARRRSIRGRRSIAAGSAVSVGGAYCNRLAEILVVGRPVKACAANDEPLMALGYIRQTGDGAVQPAIPPWDEDSLRVVVGEGTMMEAHRRLLAAEPDDPVATARHALGGHDPLALRLTIPAAVGALRERGDLSGAMDLLDGARDQLGPDFPPEWVETHAALALEDGSPARCFGLLRASGIELPQAYRLILRAHLESRSGRMRSALELARRASAGLVDRHLRMAAGLVEVRALRGLGERQEAASTAKGLLDECGSDAESADRLRIVAFLMELLTTLGQFGPQLDEVQKLLEDSLSFPGARERGLAASVLGRHAFLRGDFDDAGRFFEIAVESSRQRDDPVSLVVNEMNLAGVYYEKGRSADCEALNRGALRVCEQVGNVLSSATAHLNIATSVGMTGRLEEALRACRRARELYGEVASASGVGDGLELEVALLLSAGLVESARRLFHEAEVRSIDGRDRTPRPGLFRSRGVVGRIGGDTSGARQFWTRSIDLAESTGAEDEVVAARLEWSAAELAMGGDGESTRGVSRSLNALGPVRGTDCWVRWRFVVAMGDALCKTPESLQRGLEFLDGAIATAQRSDRRLWIWRCKAAQAGLATSLGDAERALKAISGAQQDLEELLGIIGSEALRESYLELPDARIFLAWCNEDDSVRGALPKGCSDLEVFLP